MVSTGQVTPLNCELFHGTDGDYILSLSGNDYDFMVNVYASTINPSYINNITIADEDSDDVSDVEKLFMIEVEDFTSSLQTINRISKSAPLKHGEIVIEKVNDAMADFTMKYPDRYEIGIRIVLAMVADDSNIIKIDGHLFEDLLTKPKSLRFLIDNLTSD